MRLFEVTDTGFKEGLRVQPAPDPHIQVTSNGDFIIPLDPRLVPIVRHASSKDPRPMYMARGAFSDSHNHLIPTAEGESALVLLKVSCPGGKVRLSAANDRGEVYKHMRPGAEFDGAEVKSSFGPFPPLGMAIVGPTTKRKPWEEGRERLELAVVMVPGSEFRVLRSHGRKGVPPVSFVSWRRKDGVLEMRIQASGRREDEIETRV